jgi:roadblock/LC7 domain-containing protein
MTGTERFLLFYVFSLQTKQASAGVITVMFSAMSTLNSYILSESMSVLWVMSFAPKAGWSGNGMEWIELAQR